MSIQVQDEITRLSLTDKIRKLPPSNSRPRELEALIVADLYCRGLKQVEIAEEINRSPSVVSKMIAEIREAWLRAQVDSFDMRVSNELAKIEQVEREAWAAWDRSIGIVRTETQKAVSDSGDADGDGAREKTEISVKEEFRAGNPRFLDIVDKCISRRIDLLGLKAPSRQQIHMKIESKVSSLAEEYGIDESELLAAAGKFAKMIEVE